MLTRATRQQITARSALDEKLRNILGNAAVKDELRDGAAGLLHALLLVACCRWGQVSTSQ